MAFELKEKLKNEMQELIKKYPDKKSALLPVLHALQREEGFISEEMIDALSKFLDIPVADIRGMVSFYTMFNRIPVGKYHIQVCRNLSCSLMGSEHIVEFLKRKLNIDEGETTKDGLFTLSTVECLGSCGTAPVMMINDDYYENVSENTMEKILRDLKNGKSPA
jgi:NADH-quinone oxidoreductase E subunit